MTPYQAIIDRWYPDGRAPSPSPVVDFVTLKKAPRIGGAGFPIIADSSMPPGYFELRTDTQRVGCWVGGAEGHDPGDEDRER